MIIMPHISSIKTLLHNWIYLAIMITIIIAAIGTALITTMNTGHLLDSTANGTKPMSFGVFTLANDSETIDIMWKYYSNNDNNHYVIQSIRSNPPLALFDVFRGEKKIIIVQSLDNMTKAIKMAGSYQKMQAILYDFERWDKTPKAELTNISRSVSKAAVEVHKAGYGFGIIPDSDLLLKNYKVLDWTNIDFVGMQLQKYIRNPAEYSRLAREVSSHVKSINPSIEVFGQVSFRFGNVTDILEVANASKHSVDGFIISYKTNGNITTNNDNTNNSLESCYSQCDTEDLGEIIAAIRKLRG